jgi:Ser/Thr protein kinase RdoA (MazF antagonist)
MRENGGKPVISSKGFCITLRILLLNALKARPTKLKIVYPGKQNQTVKLATNVHPYENLDPQTVLDAIETTGLKANGTFLALNSYENRVYQIGIEDQTPVVAKFYRPERWSTEAILEEHEFSLTLAQLEIPVVPPIIDQAGQSLHEHCGFRFAVFPRRGGRWPNLESADNLAWLGRFLGRIHHVGAIKPFKHRRTLDARTFGYSSYEFLMETPFLRPEARSEYRQVAEDALAQVDACYERAGAVNNIRLHGDCHPGNILWTDNGPHFVDLDDCCMGPAIQDLWMLLSGDRHEMALQLDAVLNGYREFATFDQRQLHLMEALRTLRLMHYSAWLARRWEDPAFPASFPWFGEPHYWHEQINTLREQIVAMQAPPLDVFD